MWSSTLFLILCTLSIFLSTNLPGHQYQVAAVNPRQIVPEHPLAESVSAEQLQRDLTDAQGNSDTIQTEGQSDSQNRRRLLSKRQLQPADTQYRIQMEQEEVEKEAFRQSILEE